MKKIMLALAVLATVVSIGVYTTGCHTIPSTEFLYGFSYSCGRAGAYGCELGGLTTEQKQEVSFIVNTVAAFVPKTNDTFIVTWPEKADLIIDELIKAGKLNEALKIPIDAAVVAVASSVDFIFLKYPEAKNNTEAVKACVQGSVDGFNSVIKPTLASVYGTPAADPNINMEAYAYIKKSLKEAKKNSKK